jgi:CDP-diacylglycerol---glycerol-3-phosphate 3-phosphatidyltransferase
MMRIPNILTLVRIVLVPVFVFLFYIPVPWAYMVTTIIFALAALTDWLDGYLARSLSQVTRLGAFLDPVADKLVVVTALVLLVGESHLPFIGIPAAVIIGREIVVSGLREWMAELGKRANVAVSFVGKIKTTFQMLAVILLLVGRHGTYFYHPMLSLLGYILLAVAATLTLWTMILYLRAAWPELSQGNLE